MSKHNIQSSKPGRRIRRGSAMLLVLVAVAIATVVGVTFVSTASMTTQVVEVIDDHTQARQIAESGLRLGIAYLEQEPNWQALRTNGTWVTELDIHGGKASLIASYNPDPPVVDVTVGNPSFESGAGKLNEGILGLLAPTMSGTLGGWSVARGGLLGAVTSLTIPTIEIKGSSYATQGSNIMAISFKVGVVANATVSREVAYQLEPNTQYSLRVDIGKLGVLDLLPSYSLRVKVGGTTVAQAGDGQLLTLLDLNGNFATRALRFKTGSTVPEGNVRVEFFANAVASVLQSIGYDNVRLVKETPIPVTLTVTGTHGSATHVVRGIVRPGGTGEQAQVVSWDDPW